MIAFTALGLLVFWIWCFELGYHLEPTFHAVRAMLAVWLIGREVEALLAVFAAHDMESTR